MKPVVFLINNRFVVEKAKNEVWDKTRRENHRLEPRLMKLLCLLADKCGEAVPREVMVKEIWADYPGGNEGLNQAISFLRKLLDDEDKQIIVTLPKTGYIFRGKISSGLAREPFKNKTTWVKVIFPISATFIFLITALIYFTGRPSVTIQPDRLTQEQLIKLSKTDSKTDSIIGSKTDSMIGSKTDSIIGSKADSIIGSKNDSISQADTVKKTKDK